MIILSSDRLRVELAQPGECPNDTFRFDRAGYISDIILDHSIHFCASEPRNLEHPCSGGRGLCCEFKADYSKEVSVDEYFPKLGIGLFPRGEKPYVFFMKYNNIQEFPVSIETTESSATFQTEPIPCLGIAMAEKKTISVEENMLIMETEVQNSGNRSISSGEYCHNFLSIDGMALGPDYSIELPNLPDFGMEPMKDMHGNPCNWRANAHGFAISEVSTDVSHIPVDLSALDMTDCFTWILKNKGVKAQVKGQDYFRPESMSIWAADHIISPEIFYQLELAPGETKKWRRTWTFEKES